MYSISALTRPINIVYNIICSGRRNILLRIREKERPSRLMPEAKRQISFPYDSNKAAQAILWLLHRHGGALHRLKLVKLIFYADREHLVRYGRPIVGGRYVAMPHGPVSSELLNHINAAALEANMPFVNEEVRVIEKAPVDEEYLSKSDIEVLENINGAYGALNRFVLRDLTHELLSYQKNYPNPKEKTSHPLPYEDFFLDLDDDGILDIIREHQETMDFSN